VRTVEGLSAQPPWWCGALRRDAARYFALDSRTGSPSFFEKVRIFCDSPGFQAVVVYRFGAWVNRIGFRPLRIPFRIVHYVLQKLCIIFWGIYIDEGARIGPGLYVGHFGGVILGPIEMGRDCNVAHQVTIGRRVDGIPGIPMIGDRVWIGVGSVIFGNIRIGDGVTIAPNTVVSRSLPANVMVLGNPMRVLRKNYDNTQAIYGSQPLDA
jgi:serine O-acetyltransferase